MTERNNVTKGIFCRARQAGRAVGGWVLFLIAAAVFFAAGGLTARAAEYEASSFTIGADIYVRALAIDNKAGSLWVGTSTGALEIDLGTNDLKHTFTRKDGLATEYIDAIGVAPTGEIWLGAIAGGASVYKDGKWKTYFPMHGLADFWVYAFDFDKDQNVWIGTLDGVNKFDPKTQTFETFRDGLVNPRVYSIDIDAQGAVWFGSEGGVSMLKDGAWKTWTHADGLGAADADGMSPDRAASAGAEHDLSAGLEGGKTYNPNYVFAVKVDDRGRGVWFGTWGGGVSLFDGDGHWRSYTVDDGLAGNLVYCIAEDRNGVMWFGTDNGVSSFDGETWHTYREGLPGKHFYAIATQSDGVVWAGAKGAVVKLTPTHSGE